MKVKKINSVKKTPVRKKAKCQSKVELVVDSKISPSLAWVYPYLKKAKQKMPSLVLPKKIRSHRPSKTRLMRVLGNAYYEDRTVVIATHSQMTYLNRQGQLKIKSLVRLPQARILDTLAHEMAHFQYPEHGYEHEQFTQAIFKTFGLKEKCPYCKGSGKVQLEGKY